MILWKVTPRYGMSSYRRFEGSCSRTSALSEYSIGSIFLSRLNTQTYVTYITYINVIAQSVQRIATGWMVQGSIPGRGKALSFHQNPLILALGPT
jgi:hypothetical protein